MQLPNQITVARLVLALAGAIILLIPTFPARLPVAGLLFIVCALSDVLDGYLARRRDLVSPLGTFLDPLADKILVLLYFIWLTSMGVFPVWLLMAMIVRDLLQDGYRNFAASQRVVLGANTPSKAKTGLQFLAVVLGIGGLALMERSLLVKTAPLLLWTANIAMILALLIGIVGTVQFVRSHAFILRSGE